MKVVKEVYIDAFENNWCLCCGKRNSLNLFDVDLPAGNSAKQCSECKKVFYHPGLERKEIYELEFSPVK